MLLILIFLLLIFFLVKKQKLESFNAQPEMPNLANNTLKESVNILNNYLTPISTNENLISHFYNAIEKFNYFLYNKSNDITVIIPLNSTIQQYLSWIFSDINEINQSPNIINNCFILSNIYNTNCAFDNSSSNCGPFDKNKLISKSKGNLRSIDFIIPNIRYKNGIIHIVDFLLESSNDPNLHKKDYFKNYSRNERISHLSGIVSS